MPALALQDPCCSPYAGWLQQRRRSILAAMLLLVLVVAALAAAPSAVSAGRSRVAFTHSTRQFLEATIDADLSSIEAWAQHARLHNAVFQFLVSAQQAGQQHAAAAAGDAPARGHGGSGASTSAAASMHALQRHLLLQLEHSLYPFIDAAYGSSLAWRARMEGRGIVMAAGGPGQHVAQALVGVTALRQIHQCTLPVQVWYLDDDDLPAAERARFEALPEVTTHCLTCWRGAGALNLSAGDPNLNPGETANAAKWAGYVTKVVGMLASGFAEVIFIDTDAYFFQSPEVLFDQPEYQTCGALFYRDRTVPFVVPEDVAWVKAAIKQPSIAIQEGPVWNGRSRYEQESGVVALDLRRTGAALLAVAGLNQPPVRNEVYAHINNGDKETFWFAFELLGVPYRFSAGKHGGLLPALDARTNFMASLPGGRQRACPPVMAQRAADGRLLWWHNGVLADKSKPGPSDENPALDVALFLADPDPHGGYGWPGGRRFEDGRVVGDGFCLDVEAQELQEMTVAERNAFQEHVKLWVLQHQPLQKHL